MRLADVSPETAAAFRCLYAVPLLARLGRLPDWRRPLAIVLDGLRPAAATPLP